MALIPTVLTGGLARVLGQPGDNAAAKANDWGAVYQAYAAPAQAAALLPVFTGTEQSLFVAKLLPVFNNPNSTIVQFADALASAVEAFWFLPPVPFATVGAVGAVTGFPGRPILVGQLTGILASQYDNAIQPAQQIGGALDVATRTVVVTFAPPPGSTATLV